MFELLQQIKQEIEADYPQEILIGSEMVTISYQHGNDHDGDGDLFWAEIAFPEDFNILGVIEGDTYAALSGIRFCLAPDPRQLLID